MSVCALSTQRKPRFRSGPCVFPCVVVLALRCRSFVPLPFYQLCCEILMLELAVDNTCIHLGSLDPIDLLVASSAVTTMTATRELVSSQNQRLIM